ncbi:MAG TPA: RNA-binding S4 domain-containing protein, partial [Bacteroidia bacterium]|nr:RNA-binding S4 domain-containing protein [Bacteroidia bacterium]
IKTNEILSIRRGSFTLVFQVIQPIENRVSAAIKDQFCKDLTSADEYEKIKMHSLAVRTYRQHNEGRPTKKERRALDDFLDW